MWGSEQCTQWSIAAYGDSDGQSGSPACLAGTFPTKFSLSDRLLNFLTSGSTGLLSQLCELLLNSLSLEQATHLLSPTFHKGVSWGQFEQDLLVTAIGALGLHLVVLCLLPSANILSLNYFSLVLP